MADIDGLKEQYKDVLEKVEKQTLTFEDLGKAIKFLVEVANTAEDFQDEYGGLTCTWAFNVTDKPEAEHMWMKCDKGKFSYGMGKPATKADLSFAMNAKNAADMVSGKLDSNSAFLKGDLKLDGPVKLGVKFQGVQALFRDVLDL